MKRYPWHCRVLLAGLITKIADDEGRFSVEPYGLLDTLFARHDPVTEEDVAADLALLEANETIIIYGPDRKFGFLVSWFRRQNIDSRLRRPSSRPEPPVSDLCPVTSGVFLDTLVEDWKSKKGAKKAWPVVVCREFCAMSAKERNAVRKRLGKNRKERFSTEKNEKEPADVGRETLDVGRETLDVRDTKETTTLDPPAAGPSVPVEAVVVDPCGSGDPETPEAPTANQTQPATDGAPRLFETPDAVTEADPEPDNRTYLSEPDPLKRAIWRCWSALGLEGPPASDMAADGKTPMKQYSGWYKLAQEHGDRKVNAWASVIERTKPTLPESKKPGAWFSTIFRNAMRAHWTWGWDETTQKLKEPRQAPGPVAMPQEYVDKVAEDLKDWWEGK